MGGRLVKRAMFFLLFVALVAAGAFANPSPVTAYMGVQANYTATVTLSATTLDFGDFYAGGADKTGSSVILVNAPVGLPYMIALNGGQYAASGSRWLDNSGNRIPYLLTEGGNPWGDGLSFGAMRSGVGTGADYGYAVSGHLYVNYVGFGWPSGLYMDTVTVTLTY